MSTCKARSSGGSFTFDTETGQVIDVNLNWEVADMPAKVDVEEYLDYYGQPLGTDVDVLDVGYWTVCNYYEEPAYDWRIEVQELREENAIEFR